MKQKIQSVFFNGFNVVIYQQYEQKWVEIIDDYTLKSVWKSSMYNQDISNERLINEGEQVLRKEIFE